MTLRIGLVSGFLCLLVGVGTVFSASKENEQVKLSVQFAAEYSDNRDSLDSPYAEDNLDFFLKPRLEGNLQWDNQRILLDVFYEPAYRYRTDPSPIQNDSDFQQDLGVTYEHGLTRLSKIRLVDRMNLTDDPSVQENGSTLRRDSSFLLNAIDASITHSLSPIENVTAGVIQRTKDYKNKERQDESNQDIMGANLMWWRQVTKRAGLFLVGGLSEYGYEDYKDVERDFSSMSVNGGMRVKFSTKSHLDVRLGYSSLDYADSSYGSDSAPSVSVSAKHSPVPTMSLTFGVGYGLRDSDTFPFASQEETSGNLHGEWMCTKKLTFKAGLAYRLSHYSEDTTGGYGDTYLAERGRRLEGDTERAIAAVSAGYKVGLATSLGVGYKHETADSDVGTSFERNSVNLSWSKEF